MERIFAISRWSWRFGLNLQGHKVVLGLHQGATENATVVKHLLDGIAERGVAFDVPRLYVRMAAKGCRVARGCTQNRGEMRRHSAVSDP